MYTGEPYYFCPCGVKVGTVCALFPFRPLSIRGSPSDRTLMDTLVAYGERWHNERFIDATSASGSSGDRTLPTVIEVAESSGGGSVQADEGLKIRSEDL